MIPPVVALWGGKAIGALAAVLTFGITLPVWVFLAAWLFFQWDKSGAVKDAVADLVASAEIEAAEARADAERRLRLLAEGAANEARRRANAAEAANQAFQTRLIVAEHERKALSDELDDLLAQPAPDSCIVDRSLLDRLRD